MANSSFFPAQHSVLSAQALVDQVLSKYQLDATVSCRLFHRGINDTYLVRDGAANYFLRISPTALRTQAQLEAEVDLLNTLNVHQLSVPAPVAQKDGNFVEALHAPEGVRYAILFRQIEGDPAPTFTPEQGEIYGKTAAKIHHLTDQQDQSYARFHHDLNYIFDEPLEQLIAFLTNHLENADDFLGSGGTEGGVVGYLQELGKMLKAEINQLPRTAPEYGICHGDLLPDNALFNSQNQLGLLDFDEFGYGWRAYDIAIFLWSLVFPFDRDEQGEIREAFLRGYQSIRPLSEAELKALPYFVVLHHVWAGGGAARYFPTNAGIKQLLPTLGPSLYFVQGYLAAHT